jgi:hypothetical protein
MLSTPPENELYIRKEKQGSVLSQNSEWTRNICHLLSIVQGDYWVDHFYIFAVYRDVSPIVSFWISEDTILGKDLVEDPVRGRSLKEDPR